ncbi:MAG: hypothetical protein ACLQJR_04290 [Stellaceae bacterium]
MRLSIALALLLILGAVPSTAVERSARHGAFPFARAHRMHHHQLQARRVWPSFFGPGYGDWGDFGPGYGDWADPPAGYALPPPPAPVGRERDERATVETTPQGVTIIRGPGLHLSGR